jgi:N-acetylneuraminate lyase
LPRFSGAWPALVTPFTNCDDVNVTVLREITEHLISKDVDGLYLGGTTGEGIFMSVDERNLIAETVIEQVNERIPVIIHVGALSIKDAVALARHADQIGASGISSVVLTYYESLESLYAYYSQIAQAVPELPFLGYMFGGTIDAVSLMRKLMEIPSLVGAKYSGSNMFEFRQLVQLRQEDWTIFSGMDEQCLFAVMSGSHGNVGSTLNFMPGVYREIRRCAEVGDYMNGMEIQNQANAITHIMQTYGFQGALKAVMSKIGFDCGSPRLPNLPFPEERWRTLYAELEKYDFDEMIQI